MGVAGNGVADAAAFHFAEFQKTEDPFRQRRLHGHGPAVEFHTGRQGINALPAFGNVGRLAADIHIHLAGAGHHLIGTGGDHAGIQPRPQVDAENRLHVVLVKHPGFAQILCPAGGLLRRLEHQKNVVRILRLSAQAAGQLQKNGHVAVMAAGVHLPRVGGDIITAVFLGNGQGIHIRPEGQGTLGPKVKPGTQTLLHGREYLTVTGRKSIFQIGKGFRQTAVQLRDPVQRPTVLNDLHGIGLLRQFFIIIMQGTASVNFSLVNFQKR